MLWWTFCLSPQALRLFREDSSAGKREGIQNCCSKGQMLMFPHIRAISFLQQSTPCEEKAHSVIV